MTEQPGVDDKALLAVKREWRAARLTIGVSGLIAATLIGVYFWLLRDQIGEMRQQMGHHQTVELAAQKARAERAQTAARLFCSTALRNAQSHGAVPKQAKPDGRGTGRTDRAKRFVCVVADATSKYALVADYACDDIRRSECVDLFTVVRDDDTVLYQRGN